MPTECDILDRARKGDQQAIAQLVMNYQHMVRNYLYSLAPEPSVADDLAQEVFVKLIGALERIDPKRGIKPYLMRMTRNMAMDQWRKLSRKKEKYHELFFEDLENSHWQRQEEFDDDTLTHRLEALKSCLKNLNERIYRVIMGFYYENLSCRELSDVMDTNESNIRTMLHRGRKALYACIIRKTRMTVFRK